MHLSIAMRRSLSQLVVLALAVACALGPARADDKDEITPASEAALERGLAWLAKNQGVEGSWGSSDLGLVSMGALAFMSAGQAPGRGRYGRELDQALSSSSAAAGHLGC
jgi:hypothetical protein